jgi:hypothetical protein
MKSVMKNVSLSTDSGWESWVMVGGLRRERGRQGEVGQLEDTSFLGGKLEICV